jgi:hypothetical protein
VPLKKEPRQPSIPALASDVQTLTLGEDLDDEAKDFPLRPTSSKRKTLDEIKTWVNQEGESSVSFVIIGSQLVGLAHSRAC